MLTNWDFKNEAENSSTQQINRQKSARNLEILQFDPSEPRAVFYDRKRDAKQTATLADCDCNDFNLSGSSPRKSFKPCMHIYRLAIELGLIEAKYLDQRARFALASTLSREETARLQGFTPDPAQWGGWAREIHASGIQRNRQYRAYSIGDSERGYSVSLAACDCMDFLERRLPCKHIYAAALASKISLPLTRAEFETAKKQGIEIVFEFPTNA